jgi:hypothetical protein
MNFSLNTTNARRQGSKIFLSPDFTDSMFYAPNLFGFSNNSSAFQLRKTQLASQTRSFAKHKRQDSELTFVVSLDSAKKSAKNNDQLAKCAFLSEVYASYVLIGFGMNWAKKNRILMCFNYFFSWLNLICTLFYFCVVVYHVSTIGVFLVSFTPITVCIVNAIIVTYFMFKRKSNIRFFDQLVPLIGKFSNQ